MGKIAKRLRAAFHRREHVERAQTRSSTPSAEPQGYVTHFATVVSRVSQANEIMDRAVLAIGAGDLEAQQRALEHVAELSADAAEHAIAAVKLVRARRIQRINQPERAA